MGATPRDETREALAEIAERGTAKGPAYEGRTGRHCVPACLRGGQAAFAAGGSTGSVSGGRPVTRSNVAESARSLASFSTQASV